MADPAALIGQLASIEGNPIIAPDTFERAQAVLRQGLPSRRSEAWKYTNVDRFYDAIEVTPQRAANTSLGIVNDGLEVEEFGPAHERRLPLSSQTRFEEFPLAAINGLLLTSAARIRSRVGETGTATIGAGGAHQHIVIDAERQSDVVLIEAPASYTFRHIEIHIGAGARVTHFRRALADESSSCTLVTVDVAGDGAYFSHGALSGGRLRRIDIDVGLSGPGAHAEIDSAWRIAERQHLDQHIAVTHFATDTTSRQLYRGVANDRATGVLNGRIHIARNAQRSHAELSTKNLAMSPHATINAKPELEIYADDVRCSHGATIGEMDRDALFYFRSRGIEIDIARQMLLASFLGEALNVPADEDPAVWLP